MSAISFLNSVVKYFTYSKPQNYCIVNSTSYTDESEEEDDNAGGCSCSRSLQQETPTRTPVPTPYYITPTPEELDTLTPSLTPICTYTPMPTFTPSPTPYPTPTPSPTIEPTPTVTPTPVPVDDDSFSVFFINVGQGDATLIRTEHGEYVLIDF